MNFETDYFFISINNYVYLSIPFKYSRPCVEKKRYTRAHVMNLEIYMRRLK